MNINIVQHLGPGWVWPQPIVNTTSNNRSFNVRVMSLSLSQKIESLRQAV